MTEPFTEDEWTAMWRGYQGAGLSNESALPVIVQWSDPSETPSQAIIRLNGEVMELTRQLRKERPVTGQRRPGDSCRFIRLAPNLTIVKHADDCEVFAPGVYTDPRQERSDPVITASAIRHLKAQFPDAAW